MKTKHAEEQLIYVKRQSMSHMFKYDINYVWDLIKDTKKTYLVDSDLRTEAVFTMGTESYIIGSEFEYNWKGACDLKMRVVDVHETPDYKRLHLKVDLVTLKLTHDFIYHLHKVTIEKGTLLNWEFVFEGEKGIQMPRLQIETWDLEKKILIKRVDSYLAKFKPVEKFKQSESIVIEYPAREVFKILSDWREFQKLVPKICDEVGYVGKPSEIGSNLTLNWTNKKKAKCELKVTKCAFDEEKNQYEYSLIMIQAEPKVPDQEVHFKVLEIDKLSYLEFLHLYTQRLPLEVEEKISKYKIQILKSLKKAMEGLVGEDRSEIRN
jgi:hypothetical protein